MKDYELAMAQASDQQKREYILKYLSPVAQQVIVPEIGATISWDDMCWLLIAKFGARFCW